MKTVGTNKESQPEETSRNGLRRELGFVTATSLVVGSVIGSGVFVKPGVVIGSVGSSTLGLLVWALGGLISICGGLTIAEVAARIPKTGGVYIYMEEIYGRVVGFLCGWVQTTLYGPGLIGGLSYYFGSLTVQTMGWEDSWKLPVGLASLLFLATVNIVGAKYGGMIQSATTLVKLIPIIAISVFGGVWGTEPIFGASSGSAPTASIGAAILSTLWAYDGWMSVTNVAGEMKNPARDLPRAIVVGISIVVSAYLAVNVALVHVLPAADLVTLNEAGAAVAFEKLFGPLGARLAGIGIVISIFGALNGNILTNPRVTYAMAQRGELPFAGIIGRVSERFGTPGFAIAVQACFAALMMVLLPDVNQITDLAIFSLYNFFMLAFAGLFILRWRHRMSPPRDPKDYRCPLYPIIPLIAVLGCCYMLASTIWAKPSVALYVLIIGLAGLPIRMLFVKSQNPVSVD